MAITSCLAEFSLPELFQFLDQGNKTGLLTLQFQPDSRQPQKRIRHVLLSQGHIVAVTNRLNQQCLLAMICQRGWMSPNLLREQVNRCPANQPIGRYLRLQGYLQPEQLKLLFRAQVLQPICALFNLKDAQFRFDAGATLPTTEMTGLSLSATEATLWGLRTLRNWTPLAQKLPESTSGLSRAYIGKRQLRLHSKEKRVWELANGLVPLSAIANQLQQPVDIIQQTAFLLISVGLVAEVPLVAPTNAMLNTGPEPTAMSNNSHQENTGQEVSPSFVQTFLGFLRSSR